MGQVQAVAGVELAGPLEEKWQAVLSAPALEFIAGLQRAFDDRRRALLEQRAQVQAAIDAGRDLEFSAETESVRAGDWQVAPVPADLRDRRVEITGPVERKMMINALNSGARTFMADFEDSHAPSWANNLDGQINLMDAVRGTIALTTPQGKHYALGEQPATLLVRPRGWHLAERHLRVDGRPVAGALFDFGLAFFHNARALLERGSGPYFYLPKLENHREAELWNDVFVHAQRALDIPLGSIKATVLIETLPAAFQMDEILYALREHSAGLNAGRWDYIFSAIKRYRNRPEVLFPDRDQVTMTVPFMRAYTELLVKTCHRRGAHAMGGMAAFIPSRKDAAVNERALAKVRQDKQREAGDGFDGTWVAHPDLVPVAAGVFDAVLGEAPNQVDRQRDDVQVAAADLLDFAVADGRITEQGVRNNIAVALLYLDSWLRGTGAAALFNLMEDAATAEIARSQLWQWVHNPRAALDDGRPIDAELVRAWIDEELASIRSGLGEAAAERRLEPARELLAELVSETEFTEFLTWDAYRLLD
jgi:malate synthase